MKLRVRSRAPLYVASCAVGLFLVAWSSGYSLAINSTKSMPRGLYLVGPVTEPTKGNVVALCIPHTEAAAVYLARGYISPSERCTVGLSPVIKPVVAGPGDTVRVTDAGVWVNGALLPQSRVFDTDSAGRPIAHLPLGWTKRLAPQEFFTLANHVERSLDSRYYGPVQHGDLRGRIWPLFTL